MNKYSVNSAKKKKAVKAVIRQELSAGSAGIKASYWISVILKTLGFVSVAAIFAYALLVSREPLDMIYALPALLVFYSIGMIVGIIHKAKLGGEYRCRTNEQLTVLDDRMIYSYHDVRLPQMSGRWSYDIPYHKIDRAEVSAKGYLITLHGLFQGDLLIGETSSDPDTWSQVVILDAFQCDITSLLRQHGVKIREN